MKFVIGKNSNLKAEFIFKDEWKESSDNLLNFLGEKEIFTGKAGETYSSIYHEEQQKIYVGLGEKDKLTIETMINSGFKLGKELMNIKAESVTITIPKFEGFCYGRTIQAFAEGLLNSEYAFEKFLSEKKTKPTVKEVYLDVLEEKSNFAKEKIEEIQNLMEGVFLARNLVNEPAMYLTPTTLAERAAEALKPLGVDFQIFNKSEIEKLEMKAFLSVARGSSQEPKFIIMNWKGDPDSEEKLALVGKGLTYDSGGYCIKTPTGMSTMHCDMGGAGSVIGAMYAIAKNKVKRNVVGIIAACENMISGDAYKTGDIIGSMSGKTIEVLNTDAEGRLTLADALYYTATVIKPNHIIDIATLTGAVVAALSNIYIGSVTNDQSFMDQVVKSGERACEPVWQLPSHEKYKEMVKGTFGDLKNSGTPGAGTITAGMFLENFVENVSWVHLDIAGTAYIDKADGYLPKGATGSPVKLLYKTAKHDQNKKHGE